jgi:hypothetical protein
MGDGLTGYGMSGTVGAGTLRDYTDEDLYSDKIEYYDEHSFHYRPGSGPRMKYKQWKNPLLRLWYYVKEWFSGSR